jgi:hypothetical protein
MASPMNKKVAKATFKNNNERKLERQTEKANMRDINTGTTPG